MPVWTWTDTTAAQATFTCTKDETHTATETAVITSAVSKEATCTAKGETTYTAKVIFGGVEYTDQKVAADIDMVPHTLEAVAAKEPTCCLLYTSHPERDLFRASAVYRDSGRYYHAPEKPGRTDD